MHPVVRNVLAAVAGLFVGGLINMGLIILGPSIVPYPEGIDPTNMESLQANIHLLPPKNFIMVYLAHALGTFAGAFTAAKLAAKDQLYIAMFVGVFFLWGGITMVRQLDAPMWFNVFDLVCAYIPMAWLGWKFAGGNRLNNPA